MLTAAGRRSRQSNSPSRMSALIWWDDGNARKNEKHGVATAEAEQVFFNAPLLVLEDAAHSQNEPRLHALGKTDEGRTLHITFTRRQSSLLIRVISARDMHR